MLVCNHRFGKRFDTTLLIQSAVMIITQSILLETVVRHRTPEKHESEPLKDQQQSRPRRFYDTFWQWPHYLDYVNCLLGFTTIVGVAYVLLGKLPWFVEALGIISLGIESTLPLPQCISNFKTRSTAGFSLIVLATWVRIVVVIVSSSFMLTKTNHIVSGRCIQALLFYLHQRSSSI